MSKFNALFDEYGIIYEGMRILPDETHKLSFMEALAELEDNECHRKRVFPKTRLHKVACVKQAIYRADIIKTTGWRLHIQYSSRDNGEIHLKDIIKGSKHDDVIKVIKAKKDRYE